MPGERAAPKPWFYPLLILTLGLMFVLVAHSAYNSGLETGVKQERDAKAAHDKFMRDIGTCDWAKIIAKNIQCERQLP